MPRYIFYWPMPNGDCPTVVSKDADDLAGATRDALLSQTAPREHKGRTINNDGEYGTLHGVTVGDRCYKPFGRIEFDWPGPKIVLVKPDSSRCVLWSGSINWGIGWKEYFRGAKEKAVLK